MRRTSEIFGGVVLVALAIIWLVVGWLVAVMVDAFGADSVAAVVGLLIAIAVGAGVLAGGFYLASGIIAAGWSLMIFGPLWAAYWVFQVPYLQGGFPASHWVLVIGGLVLGLAALAGGLPLGLRDDRTPQAPPRDLRAATPQTDRTGLSQRGDA